MEYVIANVPYGKLMMQIKIPKKNLVGVVESREKRVSKDEINEIQSVMENPLGTSRMSEMVGPGEKVAIVITDITRRCPEHKLVPAIINELLSAKVRNKDITIIIALGTHRSMTEKEIETKIGRKIAKLVKVVNHNCFNKKNLIYLGTTTRTKTPLWINKSVVDSNFIITTGIVEAHVMAGYSGGGKSIMPGVAGEETILGTHNPKWIDHPNVGLGLINKNPIYGDIIEAAKTVGVDFIVNVVLNTKEEIVHVVAGDVEKAHKELIQTYDEMYKIPIDEAVDIIITSPGYPKDINLYQATRVANNLVTVPTPSIKKDGVIIIPAECKDGVGNQLFYEWMKAAKQPMDILQRVKSEKRLGFHKPYLLAKILSHSNVVIANSKMSKKVLKEMHLTPASSVENALSDAIKKLGPESKVLVVPHGFSTIPILQ